MKSHSLSDVLSIADARRVVLAAQGLARAPRGRAKKSHVLAAIQRMGLLQIDSINVVARSPYLVLWSRLGDYRPEWLDELHAEGALFEYWAHALCFLPSEDYPIYRRVMLDGLLRGWQGVPQWMQAHPAVVERVRERIRQEGGLRASDFESDQKRVSGWWNWKDEKTALECLFLTGELMVPRRQSFQRVYDLRERVRPGWDDGPEAANVPAKEDYFRAQTLRAVRSLGVARPDWVAEYFKLPKKGNAARLETLAEEGRLRRVSIDGLPGPAYLDPAAGRAPAPTLTTVLSPFDPLVSDRQRLKELFGFEYKIEVYTPAHKRSFGYFTLPILHRGAVVGRLDPKAHRASGQFEIRALALEPGVAATDELAAELGAALRRLAAWHGTPELTIGRTTPKDLAVRLME